MAKLPLEGIRVVEVTVVWAGTYGTQPLSDWGAEVIRVESRQHWQYGTRGNVPHPTVAMFTKGPGGNLLSAPPNRTPGPRYWNQIPIFNGHARNKLSMTVDFTRPEGLDIFKRLIKESDVFVENNAAGMLARYGITYEVLKEVKPDIIYVSLPAFGNTGPYSKYRTWGSHLESFAGHNMIRGYHDADPTTLTNSVHCDATGATSAGIAALMALHYRNRTGKGQFIDLAQAETIAAQLGEAIMDYTMNGRVQRSLGNRDPSAIQGCYHCKGEDAWVNITISSDKEWQGFCKTIGSPAWTKEERFGDVINRYQNHDDLDKLIEEWTSQHDKYEVMRLLQKEGVPAGPVMNETDCLNDPHLKEQGFFEMVTHPDCGTTPYPGITWKMSKTPNHIRRHACLLGQDNEYVYKKVIGVSGEEYAELEEAGHIGTDYAL